MINPHWVILGAVLNLGFLSFYIRDTLRGVTQPNRMTWLLWSVAPLLAFAVELNEGVGIQSLMTFSVGFGPLLVFLASFVDPKAVWRIGRLEWVCGGLSVAGTVAWLVTREGLVALAAALLADFLAALPTLVKSWKAPETESASAFIGGLLSAGITLLTITEWTAAEAAFPIYIAVMSSLEITLIAGRPGPRLRSRLRSRSRASAALSEGPAAAAGPVTG
jgi:hypothetical protein